MRGVRGIHVFVVDKTTFPVHRDRLFCGVKNPVNERSKYSLYADIMALREGDMVFFYQRRTDEPRQDRGFRGIYKVVSEPFFDTQTVEGVHQSEGLCVRGDCPFCRSPYSRRSEQRGARRKCPSCGEEHNFHILPNRILIELIEYYEKPVDDNTAYIDYTNHGRLWTMLFRKIFGAGRERSITHILPEEGEKLIRLLRRINGSPSQPPPSREYPNLEATSNTLSLDLGCEPRVHYESILIAWMMQNLDRGILPEILGPSEEIEYFGNNVLYGIGGENVDILCLHNREGKRYKATVFEIKRDNIGRDGVEQIKDYPYWIAQLATANLPYRVQTFEIQPVLVGFRVSSGILAEVRSIPEVELTLPYEETCSVVVKKPIVLTYRVDAGSVEFSRIY